ncbi:SAICAR synthase-like protein [Tothia fuscella]|uniref:Kinase n=1 Tax=Tothia fuscella TaxID=1048955 RepID=A0A9P4NP19_9PEZI|nr:SAICAR synthase-like protein [Tothia fuscella]
MSTQFDPSTLTTFADAAAGHEGVLSDPTGAVVVKPCTEAEVAFYEKANTSHPEFARFMPAFMGTLKLGAPSIPQSNSDIVPSSADGASGSALPPPQIEGLKALGHLPRTHAPSTSIPPDDASAAGLDMNDPGPLKGRHLDTELHIVLENVASGFKQPNILDLKLGAQLWDEGAKPEKRARLDKVAGETTSGSLGFRVAGMRVWQGHNKVDPPKQTGGKELFTLDSNTNVLTYNKFYGRTFTAENVIEAFKSYLSVPSAGISKEISLSLTQNFLSEIQEIQQILESQESRMYSASILLVYEGDPVAWKEATEADARYEDEDVEDDDEDEDSGKKAFAVKLIDFAHARFEDGIGVDENMLKGVRSTVKILQELEREIPS